MYTERSDRQTITERHIDETREQQRHLRQQTARNRQVVAQETAQSTGSTKQEYRARGKKQNIAASQIMCVCVCVF